MFQTITKPVYFNTADEDAEELLKTSLTELLMLHDAFSKEIVILCIGSDRSTGDSLGPLIGYKLGKCNLSGISIYGTLQNPVHAINLTSILDEIYSTHIDPFIVAIDASLGTKEHIGFVTLCNGPLKPGLGVKKELPHVGDIHITGIVNFSGMMESLLLQTTRLSNVMNLADVICKALLFSLSI